MIDFFRQCFQQYLSTYSEEIVEDEHLLNLFAPLYGLANEQRYEIWRTSNDLRYYEVGYLLHCMLRDESLPQELHDLGDSLLEHGYDEIPSIGASTEETVQGQLKLIYTMLTKNSKTRPDLFPPKNEE